MVTKILWLDEDREYLGNGKKELQKCRDVRIETAVSVQDALEKLNASSFDMIIAEYQLRETDGITFMQKIRSRYFPYSKVPFLLFTARDDAAILKWTLEDPSNFYQNKKGDLPSQYQALLKTLVVMRMRLDLAEKPSVPVSLSLDQVMNLPFPAFSVRSDGNVGFWNFALAQLTGKEAGTMAGCAHHEYALPFTGKQEPFLIDAVETDTPKISQKYPGLLREGKCCIYDTVITDNRSGAEVIARFIAVPYFSGSETPEGMIVTVQGFSDYWNAVQEKALQPASLPRSLDEIDEKESLFRAIFEKNGAASIVISSDTTVILAKHEFARLAGYVWPESERMKTWTWSSDSVSHTGNSGNRTVLPDDHADRARMLDVINSGPGRLKNSA